MINISDTQQLKTSVTYYGTGSQTNFDFPFDYLRKAFIHVTINDVEVSDYSIDSRTIIFETAPSEGAIINIYRSTDTTRLVAWADASVLKASDMTISQVQQLHILEEGQDWSKINSIYLDDNDSKWQGNNHPMKNISDPVDAKDVVTKGYMETVQGGFVMTNTALKDEAAKQAGIANTKASEASTSASAAKTSETNAASSANMAKRWAEASDSPDNTTSKSAKTWASEASTSASAAKASETNAKSSETNAKSSETKAANSATTATEKAGIATTKASEASASASAAKTSETNAQNAASAAASSQADAANSAAEAAGAAALITFPIAIENGGTGASNASDACANIGALPTSGGTMTGAILFDSNDGKAFARTRDDSMVGIYSGVNFGGSLGLYGSNHPTAAGQVVLTTSISSEKNYSFILDSTNKEITWDDEEVPSITYKDIKFNAVNQQNIIRYRNGLQIIIGELNYSDLTNGVLTFALPFLNNNITVLALPTWGDGSNVPKITTFPTTSTQTTIRVSEPCYFKLLVIGRWK